MLSQGRGDLASPHSTGVAQKNQLLPNEPTNFTSGLGTLTGSTNEPRSIFILQ